ncbi:hypothetical protein HPB51_022116 [Rhipicephalus microplus]|uniref:Uncharacterized protein n=1 Tax=Rhipicephalus microplus TaxID=6941 RepID=A0A9J6EC24_RHIMP|nr:hypothetical protein HPB51_022116 [Rhipicephalus microplus]
MSFNPSRRKICRLVGQMDCQSLKPRDIVNINTQREQGPAMSPSAVSSSPSGFVMHKSVSSGKSSGCRKASAAPQMSKDFPVNSKVTAGTLGPKDSTSQFLKVQMPVSLALQFMATRKLDAGELNTRQSVSLLGSDDGSKIPTTSHISRRPKPQLSLNTKAEEPGPVHSRPYEEDPIWKVWKNNHLLLTQLLKMLLRELCSISDYTKIDEPTPMAAAGLVGSGVSLDEVPVADVFATSVAASSIIGGMYDQKKVRNALHNPAWFLQLYPPMPQVKVRSPTKQLSSEAVREHIDLSIYFNKLTPQMEALTQALKLDTILRQAEALMENRLMRLKKIVGRLTHSLSDISMPIVRPVYSLHLLISCRVGITAAQQMQVCVKAQMDNGECVSMANRANVTFQIDRSSS